MNMEPESKPRILMVDDEPNILQDYTRTLRSSFEVITATSEAAGLDILHKGDGFAVVVSDLRMPQISRIRTGRWCERSLPGCGITSLRASTLLLCAAALGIIFAAAAWAQKPSSLKPTGYVDDFAGVISAGTRAQLEALCTEVDQRAQAQIAVVTIRSLHGDTIDGYANNLFTQWGIGGKKSDRGVLILVSPADHKYRVEVGYGLEPILPDGKVGDFGRAIVPDLRRGDYSGALLYLTTQIAQVIAADRHITLASAPRLASRRSQHQDQPLNPLTILIILGILGFGGFGFFGPLLFGAGMMGGRRRGGGPWIGPWGGGGFGGGGFGGFGGGGGGFGGFGGGMSGGGGASGSW